MDRRTRRALVRGCTAFGGPLVAILAAPEAAARRREQLRPTVSVALPPPRGRTLTIRDVEGLKNVIPFSGKAIITRVDNQALADRGYSVTLSIPAPTTVIHEEISPLVVVDEAVEMTEAEIERLADLFRRPSDDLDQDDAAWLEERAEALTGELAPAYESSWRRLVDRILRFTHG